MAGILSRSYFLYLRLNAANYVTKDRNVGVNLELFHVCISLNISMNPPPVVSCFCLMDSRPFV
jgi:hypothetical protein